MVPRPTNRALIHPGEILLEEFLKPYGMTQSALAERIGISFVRVKEIVNGKRGITADTALRLAPWMGETHPFLFGVVKLSSRESIAATTRLKEDAR